MPEQTVIPGLLVSHVVELPFAAHPTSVYREYDYDARQIEGYVEGFPHAASLFKAYLDETVYGVKDHWEYLEKMGGMQHLNTLAGRPNLGLLRRVTQWTFDYTPSELMAAAGARELQDRQVVAVGLGLPVVASFLAKQTHAPNMTILFELGVIDPEPFEPGVGLADPRVWYRAKVLSSFVDILGTDPAQRARGRGLPGWAWRSTSMAT